MSPIKTLCSFGLTLILLLTLVGQSLAANIPQSLQAPYSPVRSSAPNGIDLDVTYISREPRYNWNSTKQWPALGELVTFTAHVINKGSIASGLFPYEWHIDGQVVQSGTASSISPGNEATYIFVWAWQTGQHFVNFKADSQNLIAETAETNNEIIDITDAMSIGFWVEQSVYNEFNNVQNGAGTYSWEDWAQRIVNHMNWMFEQSVFPLAPEGGLTRVRLDKITVVPDGTLFNLNYQHAPREYVTDVQWGFSIEEYRNCSMTHCYDAPWWVIHELMHYLYGRIDIYAFDVQGGDVKVRDEHGNLIAGTPLLPFIHWDVVYYASRSWDLMHVVDDLLFSDYTIYSLNADWPAGQRTHRGWLYFLDLPAETKIRVLDNNNQPISNIQVSLYQAVWGDGSSGPYSQNFDNVVDISGTTDSQGLFSLGSQPFGNLNQYGTPAGVALIKLHNLTSGQSRYVWFELTDVNLAYWRGETGLYVHNLYYSEDPKSLKIDNNQLSFVASQGTNPVPQNVKIDLIGEGVSEWSVSLPSQSWLRTIPSLDLDATSYPPGPLTFIINSANLPIGTYTSEVNITASAGVHDSPQTITITLRVVPTPTFSDVSMDYWAWDWIERLFNAGITTGCSTTPRMYCPEDSVTRAQMAVFLERGMHGADYILPSGTGKVFADVPLSYWAVNWIEKLYADGVTTGCGTSPLVYCPEDSVTRAQMAVFLLRAKYGAGYTPPSVTGIFTDVPTTYWAAHWIEQLYAEGITTGCGTSPLTYCPEDSVTRAEMAVFLVRTFNLP